MLRKILYFAIVGKEFGGVEQKILGQFDAIKELNADINLILVSKFRPGSALQSEIDSRDSITVLVNSCERVRKPWSRRKEKFDLMNSVLGKFNHQNTIVYLRDPLADIYLLRFLKKNKNHLFVSEHQDIENTLCKFKIRGRLVINLLELIWGKQCRRYITGFVGVTDEITDYERSVAEGPLKLFKTIGNGIDIKKYPLRLPETDSGNNEIRILFVGSGFRTHGLDRLLKSLHEYFRTNKDPRQIILKVAGDSHEMHLNRRLAKRFGLSSRVIFEGHLEGKNLSDLFNWANIGVGSLGIHRKGLIFTSELKAREYCARGLPFFWSTSDSDFLPDWPYILRIPQSNRKFNLDTVISFADRMKADTSHHIKMRKYSNEFLDWSVKMKELVSFFEEIIKSTKSTEELSLP
jgi:glycosyltransferase involved in cell wall biosynthesis